MPESPEQLARREIDRQLTAAGWLVQNRDRMNLHAAPGIALCETDVETGFADYMLFVDVIREVFGEGNDFCKKITYRTGGKKAASDHGTLKSRGGLPRALALFGKVESGTTSRQVTIGQSLIDQSTSAPPDILQSPIVESHASLRALANRFPLTWTHYTRLLRVRKTIAREFYETEALRGGWSVRQLERQIGSQFYERTALSRNKAAMLAKGAKPQPGDLLTADEEVRDPLVLEFLNLKDEYSESDLEDALIRHLEHFLLELGGAFAFVARQRRLRIDHEWHLRLTAIPVPPGVEQAAIVREVEQRLAAADPLAVMLNHQLTQARAARQAMMREAFAGWLVPQDPDDAPAWEIFPRQSMDSYRAVTHHRSRSQNPSRRRRIEGLVSQP